VNPAVRISLISLVVIAALGFLRRAGWQSVRQRLDALGQLLSKRPRTTLLLICAVALIPMLHLSWLVKHYAVEVPTLDDWEMAELIVKSHHGQLQFADIFKQQEEARTVLPKLIFVWSGADGRWDVRDQMMLSVICCWLTAAGLFLLLRRSGLHLAALALCFWLIAITLFSNAQFELWIFASGFPSFLPGLFVVAALVVLQTNLSVAWKFSLCGILAIASSFSLPHGLLAWGLTFPALLPGRRVPRWKWWLGGWVVLVALCTAAYFWGYAKPSYLPAFAPPTPLREYVGFFLEFLGGGLAYSLKNRPAFAALIFGAVQLGLFFASLVYSMRRWRDAAFLSRITPWMALGFLALGSAALAMLGRVGYGASYALASRYVTFSLYLTIAVIALVAIIGAEIWKTHPSSRRRALVVSVSLLLALAYLLPFKVCSSNTRFFLRALSAKDRLAHAAVLFSPVLDTAEVIKKTAYPGDAKPVQVNADALDRLGLLRPRLLRTSRLNALPHQAADGKSASGACDAVTPVDAERIRATGWAVLNQKGRPADCVAVACQASPDAEWIIIAISDTFEMRADVVKRFRTMEQVWSGWTATYPKSSVPEGARLSFWAVDADEPKLYQLEEKFSPK